jgi:hypothetical protein
VILTPDGAVDVVLEHDRTLESLPEQLAKRHIEPLEVQRRQDDTTFEIHRAGCDQTDRRNVIQRHAGLHAGGLGAPHDVVEHMFEPAVRLRLALRPPP